MKKWIAGLVAAALATVLGGAPGSASAAQTEISVGTHNTHYGDASFEPFAGVIGWQEVNDPVDREK